jgi:uncharacterized membrane protein
MFPMQYFVISANGQKFGPADLYTLAGWVKEGRILPNTMMEEVGSGRQVMANQVAGLGFPAGGDYYQGVQPSPASYPRIVETPGDKLANTAKALGISGFFLCPVLCLVGIGVAFMAMNQGSTKAKSAMAYCVGAIALQILLYVLFYGLLMSSLGSMTNGIG